MLELHIDLSRSARTAARADNTLTQSLRVRPEFVLRDTDYPVRLYLYDENGDPTTITEEQILALAGKSVSEYTSAESDNLFFLDTFTLDTEAGYYSGSLNLNTTEFIAAMQGRRRIDLVVEVELQGPEDKVETVVQVDAIGVHDVHRGDEGEPVDAGPTLLTTTAAAQLYFRVGQLGDGEIHLVRIDATATGQQVLFAVPAGYSARIGMLEIVTVAVDTANDPPELEVSLGTAAAPEAYLETFVVQSNTVGSRHVEEFVSDLIPAETEIALTIHTASNSTGHTIDAGIYVAITADPEEEE